MKNTDETCTRRHRPMRRVVLRAVAAAGIFTVAGAVYAQSVQEQRDDVRTTVNDTLNPLYAAQPNAKRAIANAAGYGVFNDFGMKILFAGGGTGKGLVVNNRTKKETF